MSDTRGAWAEAYRKKWTWDKVTWGTHLVDCYPGNCLWRVYTKDGVVLREEQAAKYPIVDSNSPDFNPRGCQKGACYSNLLQNPDRVTHPMKRVGERGSGKWKRVSWDQALKEIAEGILDALEEQLEFEAELQGLLGKTEDHAVGLTASLEGRAPAFSGK